MKRLRSRCRSTRLQCSSRCNVAATVSLLCFFIYQDRNGYTFQKPAFVTKLAQGLSVSFLINSLDRAPFEQPPISSSRAWIHLKRDKVRSACATNFQDSKKQLSQTHRSPRDKGWTSVLCKSGCYCPHSKKLQAYCELSLAPFRTLLSWSLY